MKLPAIICVLVLCAGPAPAQQPRAEEAVSFPAADGWTIHADWLPPSDNAPVLLLLHAQKSSSAEWKLFKSQLKRYGYGYLAPDFRGHGRSVIDVSGATVTWKNFRYSGADNEYNKMIRDVDGALVFLSTRSISTERLVLAGSILGANLAIKTAAIYKEIPKVLAFSPVLNVNDVLVVNPLRAYGPKPLLLVSGAGRERQFKEFQLLSEIARLSCGADNVITIVEAKGFGSEMLNRYNSRRVLDWLKHSSFPPVVGSSSAYIADGLAPWPPVPADREDLLETEEEGASEDE